MKALIFKSIFLTLAIAFMVSHTAVAQRIIKGTVYREGKIAAGVTVEGQKAKAPFMTSFDGIYEINVPENCKYIKFTFIDETKKLDIEGNTSNVIDFSFDGVIPAKDSEESEPGAILKTAAELVTAGDKDFMSLITLERQFYEQKDYKSALGPWRKLYKTYPKSNENIYIHGLKMYRSFIEATKDHTTKYKYIDTLMNIYDHRIKYFNRKGLNIGNQGIDYLKYTLENENLTDEQKKQIWEKGYGYVSESTKLQKDTTDAVVLLLLMQTTRGLYSVGKFDKEKVIESYDVASKYLNKHLGKEPTNADIINIRDIVDQIFQSSGAADCEALISIYGPKFDQIAANIEDLKKMIRMLDRQKCDASPLFAKASEKLYSLEPSAEAAYNMARLFVKADQLDKAETYYKQAIDLEKDPINLAKYYLELGQLNFSKPQVARGYLKKSIENNPSAGKAYIMLGDIYAHNSKSYGESDFEKTLVFLVACDYYAKAKKADASVEAEANQKIATYSQYFPPKEEIFFNGMTVGQSYTLGGWIGETTTIREKR